MARNGRRGVDGELWSSWLRASARNGEGKDGTGSFSGLREEKSGVKRDCRRVEARRWPQSPVWRRASTGEALESTVNSFDDFLLDFDLLKLQISYRNLAFGQTKSCRAKEELQLSFWAKVDSKLGSRRKTRSNIAKSKVTKRTRLALTTNLSPRLAN